MAERAAEVGGTLVLRNRLTCGVRITATLPLAEVLSWVTRWVPIQVMPRNPSESMTASSYGNDIGDR